MPCGAPQVMMGWAAVAAAVSPFLAWIGSPCLRHCVHGVSIGGGGGGGRTMATREQLRFERELKGDMMSWLRLIGDGGGSAGGAGEASAAGEATSGAGCAWGAGLAGWRGGGAMMAARRQMPRGVPPPAPPRRRRSESGGRSCVFSGLAAEAVERSRRRWQRQELPPPHGRDSSTQEEVCARFLPPSSRRFAPLCLFFFGWDCTCSWVVASILGGRLTGGGVRAGATTRQGVAVGRPSSELLPALAPPRLPTPAAAAAAAVSQMAVMQGAGGGELISQRRWRELPPSSAAHSSRRGLVRQQQGRGRQQQQQPSLRELRSSSRPRSSQGARFALGLSQGSTGVVGAVAVCC
jgi:hypothetical protein